MDISYNIIDPSSNIYSLDDIEVGNITSSHKLEEVDFSLETKRNSPILMDSVYGSGSNSEVDEEHDAVNDEEMENPYSRIYKKLRYKDVERSIMKYYEVSKEAPYSNELDILITFIRGQNQLYLEAKNITQYKLHCLMFPTLLISALLTITSPYLSCNQWNLEITSGMNAIVTFFISLIHYLKLESMIESYSQMSTHLDTIYTSLEMTNSKISFLHNESQIKELIISKFAEVEERIKEHRLHYNVSLPQQVNYLFPIISHVNVFHIINKYKHYQQKLIEKLRTIKNEIRNILFRMEQRQQFGELSGPVQQWRIDNEKKRLTELFAIKDAIKEEIIEYQGLYGVLDDLFSREIKESEIKKKSVAQLYTFLLSFY